MISLLYLVAFLLDKSCEIFYVGSSDILPEPLSKEDEEAYLVMAMDGDLHARDVLIEHNLRLVVFLAKKYENTKVDLEDLVSIGTIGLIKGINTFKPDKNIKLATYASRCIDNEILMYLRKIKKSKNISSQISSIENISEELRNHKSLMQQAMLKMCQIEARLSTIEEQSDVEDQINNLRQEIENKTDFLKEKYDIEAAMKNAGKYINRQMNELGNKLHFEASYSPINLHFDLDTFDLYHLDNSRKIYLRSMGSGANWLYCHLCLFLSLNRFFCKLGDQCHIPPILFLDQPSQVYFPDTIKDTENEFNAEEIIRKAGKTNVYQNDIQAVENFFDQIVSFCNETKNKTGYVPQIIICDHADNLSLKNADFNKLIRKRWRGDHEGLINLNLTENPIMFLDLFKEDFSN